MFDHRHGQGRLFSVLAVVAAVACSATDGGDDSPGGGGGGGGIAGGAAGTAGDGGIIQDPDAGPKTTTVVIGPGADPSAPDKFGGTDDPAQAPELVYPDSGIIVPPNMNSLEFHFIPSLGQTLFELSFESTTLDFVVYFGCQPLNGGCVFAPDAQFWGELAKAAAGNAAVSYTLRGVDGAAPGPVGSSEERQISFSRQDITGGLYYWNSSGVIQRYDFGFPLQQAELYMTPPMAGALTCVGCHVMSRDGKQMVVGKDIPAPAPYTVFDVATRTTVTANGQALTGRGNFFSFSPDGNDLLYSSGAKIGWRDLVSGQIVNDSLVSPAAMPDWSPDGTEMVYAKPGTALPVGSPGVDNASLELLHFNAGSRLWNNPRTLVPSNGGNNYYPAFDPTGSFIVYNRSPGNHNSYNNVGVDTQSGVQGDGELWAVSAAGGTPIRLDAATDPGACSWPKWAPDLAAYWGGTVTWLTFSSARAYGLRLAENERIQLWMVGFDAARAERGEDPSFPAFWLPFQDIAGGNHIAQWVTSVARKPCVADDECEATERCEKGRCVPVVK